MMGSYSSNKGAIPHILSENNPLKYAASLFDSSERTIAAARSMSREELRKTLLFVKQRSGKSQHLFINQLKKFREFIELECPTPNGSKKDEYVQTLPIGNLYENFLEWRKQKVLAEEERNLTLLEEDIINVEKKNWQCSHLSQMSL